MFPLKVTAWERCNDPCCNPCGLPQYSRLGLVAHCILCGAIHSRTVTTGLHTDRVFAVHLGDRTVPLWRTDIPFDSHDGDGFSATSVAGNSSPQRLTYPCTSTSTYVLRVQGLAVFHACSTYVKTGHGEGQMAKGWGVSTGLPPRRITFEKSYNPTAIMGIIFTPAPPKTPVKKFWG